MRHIAKTLTLAAVAIAASLAFIGCAKDTHDHSGHDHDGHSHGGHEHAGKAQNAAVKPYPLDKCLVSDDAFDHGKPHILVHNGQEIKLCCEDCVAPFQKEPEKFLSKLGKAN